VLMRTPAACCTCAIKSKSCTTFSPVTAEAISTGVLNRLLRAAFEANPPPTIGTKRLKLFYAAQSKGDADRAIDPPKFILFVNQPKLLSDSYGRYLEGRIRGAEPYPGLPVLLTCRARSEQV
jgi:GTPase